MPKPNCYECVHRRNVPGSTHSGCAHPEARGGSALETLMGVSDSLASRKLGVVGDLHGIKMGWFSWPWDFDPAWLLACDGFAAKENVDAQLPPS